jgi:4-amino-4-deoxy-L-arabinose transferase-like glycosyltransferase
MRHCGKGAAVFLLYFGLAVVYQWWYGAFEREFDGYPDEPAHYVTGVMAREYLRAGFPGNPIRFAEDYYLHYPKVAIGHWPPMFYGLEAVWMLVFGVSRASALLMVAGFAALVTAMLHAAVRRRLGTMYAFWAGAILLSIRLVQRQAGMVMLELPLTAFTFGAMLAFAAYLEKGRLRHSAFFGLAAAGAIWTKGDGIALALVPPLALLLGRDWKPARRAAFWMPVAIVAVLCVPLMLLTLGMARQGWSAEKPGMGLAAGFAVEAGGILRRYAGWGLLALAAYGLWDRVLRPLARHERPEPFWTCGAAYTAAVLGFQIGMPAGMEPRKLVMLAPALALLAAAGCERLARTSLASRAPARRWCWRWRRPCLRCSIARHSRGSSGSSTASQQRYARASGRSR